YIKHIFNIILIKKLNHMYLTSINCFVTKSNRRQNNDLKGFMTKLHIKTQQIHYKRDKN
ncbi:MAG: hypothetical protein RLZZ546_1136, partial [Bacteroidota bacterium]